MLQIIDWRRYTLVTDWSQTDWRENQDVKWVLFLYVIQNNHSNSQPTSYQIKLNTKSISLLWNKTKTNQFWVVLCFQTNRQAELSHLPLKPRHCALQFDDSRITTTDSYFRDSPSPPNNPWQHLPSCHGVQITHDWLIFSMLARSTRCRVGKRNTQTDRKSLSVYFSVSEDVLDALDI